jgi:hypothetical protein
MATKAAAVAVVSDELCLVGLTRLNEHFPSRISLAFTLLSVSEKVGFKHEPEILPGCSPLLNRNPETISALQAFRKRHSDAVRVHHAHSSHPTTVDFAHYRSALKNNAIVDEAEKLLKDFKPVTYDVNSHIKAIETFEAKAVCARLALSCWF